MLLSEDPYSKIYHEPELNLVKLVWLKTTSNMTDDDFKTASERFAIHAAEIKVIGLAVDVRNFRHKMQIDIGPWRIETLIPKYHDAGASKFAFIHNDDFSPPPNNGEPREGENFITSHFGSVEGAKTWLTS